MSYSLESLSDDCYEGTTVLINKFDIHDENQLSIVEQGITGALIAKAFIEIPFENVDFEFYKKLHQYVFGDIYDWAGEVRKINMSKKGTSFCVFEEIENTGTLIFEKLKKDDYLKGFSDEEFISEFTDLYCSLNYLHPYREGNGRIQRLFLSMLLKNSDKTIDFSMIDKDEFMIATIKSVSGDVFLLRDIFRKHIKST